MIDIKPFKGYLPKAEMAEVISTRPINSYSHKEITELMSNHPVSFLNIILHDEPKREMPLEPRFKKIGELFEKAIEENSFYQSKKEAFYIYRQSNARVSYCGIIAGASTENYRTGHIKKHEHTLEKREKLFKTYLSLSGFNAEPVLMVYPRNESINQFIDKVTSAPPHQNFEADDDMKHEIWEVTEQKDIDLIQQSFETIPSVYIADGHHRSASSNLLAIDNPNNEKAQYVMSLLMNEDEVQIHDFNRLLKNEANIDLEEIKNQLATRFEIIKESEEILSPREKHEFTLYGEQKWIRFRLKVNTVPHSGIIEQLDPQIITDHILSPIFGIHDLKNDKRVSFEPGNKGLKSLKHKVDNGSFDVAIAMFPVSFAELKLIADNKLIMPPKSTYIEPKLRSGLTVYKF